MADLDTGAPASEPDVPKVTSDGTGSITVSEAGRALAEWRNKLNTPEPEKEPPPDKQARAPEATPADESADEADAAPPEKEAPGETEDVEPAPEAPPIDPPRSWTKDARDQWQSLPRETQSYLAEREQERDREVRRSQNEAAEQLKGLTAREQAMETARLQYEQLTQTALQALQSQLQGEFHDIQTMDDVKRLANEDWARYLRWDAHQKDIAAKMSVVREANERQAKEAQTSFAKFAEAEDKKFIERVPEFAEPEKAAELQKAAISVLKDLGFTDDELAKHWNGQEKLSLRDHRVQALIADGVKYQRAQAAARKAVANKSLPPVVRPGMSQPKTGIHDQIESLQRQLDNATGNRALQLGAQLARARREAGSR